MKRTQDNSEQDREDEVVAAAEEVDERGTKLGWIHEIHSLPRSDEFAKCLPIECRKKR